MNMQAATAPHLLGTLDPELPALLRRAGDLADRDLDADDGAGVAGARADGLGDRPRHRRRPPDAAHAAARAVRRADRRSHGQAEADGRAAGPHGRAGADPRRAHADPSRDVHRRVRPRGRPRPQQLLREPRAAGVRARDGRVGQPPERRQPELHARERRPRDRSGDRRRPDRHGRRGLVLHAERAQLRRGRVLADEHGPVGAPSEHPNAAQQGPAARRLPLRRKDARARRSRF